MNKDTPILSIFASVSVLELAVLVIGPLGLLGCGKIEQPQVIVVTNTIPSAFEAQQIERIAEEKRLAEIEVQKKQQEEAAQQAESEAKKQLELEIITKEKAEALRQQEESYVNSLDMMLLKNKNIQLTSSGNVYEAYKFTICVNKENKQKSINVLGNKGVISIHYSELLLNKISTLNKNLIDTNVRYIGNVAVSKNANTDNKEDSNQPSAYDRYQASVRQIKAEKKAEEEDKLRQQGYWKDASGTWHKPYDYHKTSHVYYHDLYR